VSVRDERHIGWSMFEKIDGRKRINRSIAWVKAGVDEDTSPVD
jgi:hypothetical protein